MMSSRLQQALNPKAVASSSVIKDVDCQLAKSEKADCVVRAMAVVTQLPYEKAHELVRLTMGRKPKQGTPTDNIHYAMNRFEQEGMRVSPNRVLNVRVMKNRRFRLQTFINNNPVGKFVLIVRGHMFAVVDGVLHDNKDIVEAGGQMRRIINAAFEIK